MVVKPENYYDKPGLDAEEMIVLLVLKQTIEPLYQIARNQGYDVWQEEANGQIN